ncbi:MAG: phosphatidylinositol-specific phospholipase C1-like protein [Sphingomonas sp.]|uniref:phosphatidylinositol-specific phospholipase C1-like protein n=1 Tax=Sphingomonas sp. TaxID=28214 RepID=UPI003567706E
MSSQRAPVATAILPLALLAAAAPAPNPAPLRLNDISVVGTHNSYKLAMPAETMAKVRAASPAIADMLDYAHRPLAEQLDAGARQLEIDVNCDPKGGFYAKGSSDPKLLRPGFKVLHIPGIDNSSSCVLLTECLRSILRWSDKHPGHVPIMLMFNAKDEKNAWRGGIDALPFDAAAWDALDAEIRSVMPAKKLIVPDEVQGKFPTLRDAVRAGNWPTLAKARGRFLFALDESPEKVAGYRGARRSLEGRVFFISTDEESPAAAYLTINDPIAEGARIRRDVAAGYLVRTRADADTKEARVNDTKRREAALASGAQYVSTDYLWPDARFAGGYQVRLPGGATARCNSVRRAADCPGGVLEKH